MITWCAVHTHPFKEFVAKQHLLTQGYEVYVPRFKKTVRHARKIEEKLAPLFPRYIFLGMDLNVTTWRSINSTRGVSHLLMSSDFVPAKIPAHIISELRAQEVGDGSVPVTSLVTFVKGEKVRIRDGVFADQAAIFESMDDQSRVQLLLTFMGKDMRMTFSTGAVEAA